MQARTILIPLAAGTAVVAGLGVADAATTPHPAKAAKSTKARAAGLLTRLEHGTIVVKGPQGKPLTLVIARGTVSSVSPSSVTVTSADQVATTYAITLVTKVRQRGTGLTTASSVVSGAVEVVGVQHGSTDTARRIVIAKAETQD